METLTRLVAESMARHGFDRPLDYRRLQWSRWFRCESHHSLLCVPSKPGVFAVAEEVMNLGEGPNREGHDFSRSRSGANGSAALGAESYSVTDGQGALQDGIRGPSADSGRRMLAVTQFFEDDDMAFVLDRMLSHNNPMCARLQSGRYFVRFVEIGDQAQRHTICNALNQWIASSAEKATGIGSHFATSLELTPVKEQADASGSIGRLPHADPVSSQNASTDPVVNRPAKELTALEAVTATTVRRIPLFPSGF